MKQARKSIWGWALYDWANSAFATTVMAGFFPIFFKQFWSLGANVNQSTARLGLANSLASLLVALVAPLLGALADRGGARKRMLMGFTYLGVLMTACLYLVPQGRWPWAVFCYLAGTVGFSGGVVFYDALLPQVAPAGRLDRVSALGFSLGYLGGGLLFALNVLMTLHPQFFGLNDAAQAVRLSFVSVALWWGGFAMFTWAWVPETRPAGPRPGLVSLVRQGLDDLRQTLAQAARLKTLFTFLVAYWFYIDGVDTIIRMAVDYGLSLGFSSQTLIAALLIVQAVGFPATLLFGRLATSWGPRRGIYLALAVYVAATIWGVMMERVYEFYTLAVMVGLVQGGVQALSRSFYARLIPAGREAQFYGFYNMLGKFAAILGPALMGGVGLLARWLLMPPAPSPAQMEQVGRLAARCSMASVLLLLLLGMGLLALVNLERGQKEAQALGSPEIGPKR